MSRAENEPSGLLVYGSGGVMYAQFALLGFLLVCLPVRLVVQVLVVCTLGLAFWLSVLVGAFVFDSPDLGDVDEAAKFFPVVVLALATPFALAKYFLGWQFQMDGLARPENSRMSTISLMAATGLVAVSMAILNLGSQELVLIGLLGAAIAAAVSLFFLLPLTKVVLRSDRPFTFLTLISIVTICFALLADLGHRKIRWHLKRLGKIWHFVRSCFVSLLVWGRPVMFPRNWWRSDH